MKILLFFRWSIVVFYALALMALFSEGEMMAGVAVIPVLFFAVLPVFPSLFNRPSDLLPKPAMDAKTVFYYVRSLLGSTLCTAGIGSFTKQDYWGIPLLPMGLIFLSPLDKFLFMDYQSIIPALSVPPRFRTIKIAMALWWGCGVIVFIVGDSLYMYKSYIDGSVMIGVGFAFLFINPVSAMYKNWDPSVKSPTWTDIKADFARISREQDAKQAERRAVIKAKAAAAVPKPASIATPSSTQPPAATPTPSSSVSPSASVPMPTPETSASPPVAAPPASTASTTPPLAAPTLPPAEPPSEYLLLIRKGESSTLEFKSTLRVDIRTQKAEKFIQHSVLKTLAAFLNSQGGTLLIGVDDNKNILGLSADFDSFSKPDKLDEFQKFLDTLLANSIGNRFHRYLDVEFPEIEGKTICIIRVKTKAGDPVYIKNETGQELFYIRRLASTVDLPLSEATKYIREHWD